MLPEMDGSATHASEPCCGDVSLLHDVRDDCRALPGGAAESVRPAVYVLDEALLPDPPIAKEV